MELDKENFIEMAIQWIDKDFFFDCSVGPLRSSMNANGLRVNLLQTSCNALMRWTNIRTFIALSDNDVFETDSILIRWNACNQIINQAVRFITFYFLFFTFNTFWLRALVSINMIQQNNARFITIDEYTHYTLSNDVSFSSPNYFSYDLQ